MKLKKLFRRIDKALVIYDNPNMDWKEKFDVIFNMGIWIAIERAGCSLSNWIDPDTSYEEDIRAFCKALKDFKRKYDV